VHIVVGGEPARLQRARAPSGLTAGCPVRTVRVIDVEIQGRLPGSLFEVRACIGGPDWRSISAQVMRLVYSVRQGVLPHRDALS